MSSTLISRLRHSYFQNCRHFTSREAAVLRRRTQSPSSSSTILFVSKNTRTSFRGRNEEKDATMNNKQQPQSRPTTVAVIGGGIAGLSFASHLTNSSNTFEVTVFDTGRLRPGGRCSSRMPGDIPKEKSDKFNKDSILQSSIVDHAAQLIQVDLSSDKPNPFVQQILKWEQEGIVTRLKPNTVGELLRIDNDNNKTSDVSINNIRMLNKGSSITFFHGTQGMGSIPLALASSTDFNIEQDVWVSPNSGVKFSSDKKWQVKGKGQILGTFDKLVVAHNGKCADRLMSSTPAKQLHSLLRVNFSDQVPSWGGKRMTLNSIYSLVFALKSDTSPLTSTSSNAILPSNLVSLFIKNDPNLTFLSCNSRKYSSSETNYEIWTLLSSATFAKTHKGPQEFLPDDLVEDVTQKMLSSLEQALQLPSSSISSKIQSSRLQLWGAAVPLNTWQAQSDTSRYNYEGGFVYDSKYGVGICGDWLLSKPGPSIESAWESGRRLAHWMSNELQDSSSKENADYTVGLPTFSTRPSSSNEHAPRGNSNDNKRGTNTATVTLKKPQQTTQTSTGGGKFVRNQQAIKGGIASFDTTRKQR